MKVVGVLLLLTGLTVTLILRFSPVMGIDTVRESKAELPGKFHEKVAPVQWTPAIGSVLIVAGAAIVVANRKRKRVSRQMPREGAKHQRPQQARNIKELQINNPSGIFYARKNSVH